MKIPNIRECSTLECRGVVNAKGLCLKCYQAARKAAKKAEQQKARRSTAWVCERVCGWVNDAANNACDSCGEARPPTRMGDESYPGYPGWVMTDCGCCAGIEWGGLSPRECRQCGGGGYLAKHVASGTVALYPGGPLRWRERPPDSPRGDSSSEGSATPS